jgi:hypothetical protein
MIDQIQRWSSLAGLPATVADAGPPFRVRLSLEDIRPPMVVEVQGPAGPDDPYRFHSGFDLPAASISGLQAQRVSEIVEAAVLGRSALADARHRNDGTGVEMIAVIYPDGLTRHTFMTAIYECQKLRQIITRDVEAALVAESALSSLLALAETSEDLAATVAPGATAAPDTAQAPPLAAVPPVAPPTFLGKSPPPEAPPAATWPDLTEPPPTLSPVLPADPPLGVSTPLSHQALPHDESPSDDEPEQPPRPTWDPPPLPNVPPPIPPGSSSDEPS